MSVAYRRTSLIVVGLVLTASIIAVVSFAAPARADSTCRSLVQTKVAELRNTPSYDEHEIQLTIHRQGNSWVSYSLGSLRLDTANTGLTGLGYQVFSDRYTPSQPSQRFNQNAGDRQAITINPNGLVTIHNQTWNYTTTLDMTCNGALMTKTVPNDGQYTLSFTRRYAPIF